MGANERAIDLVIRASAVTAAAFAQVEKELASLEAKTKKTGDGADGAGKGLLSFSGSLSTAFAGAGIVLGAVTTGVTALGAGIVALGTRGADVADIRESFNTLNKTIGNDGTKSLASLKTAFAGTVSDYDLMKSANTALSLRLKLSSDDFGLLGKSARVLADRTGGDATTAFETLTQAMATGKTKTLAQIGVMVDAERASYSYAKSIGKAASDLTDAEKKDATAIATKQELTRILGESGEAAFDFGDAVAASKTFVSNFTDTLGEAIAQSPVVNAMLASFGEGLQSAFGVDQSGLVKTLIGYVNKFAIFIVDAGRTALTVAGYIGRAWSGLQYVFALVAGGLSAMVGGFIKLAAQTIDLMSKVPGLGDKFKGAAQEAMILSAQADGITDSFRAQAKEALEGVKGNNAWGKAIETGQGFLTTMRGEMVKAQSAHVDLTDKVKHGVVATDESTGAVVKLTKADKDAIAEKQRFAKEVDAFTKGMKDLSYYGLLPGGRDVKDLTTTIKDLEKGLPPLTTETFNITNAWKEFPKAIKSTGEVAKDTADTQEAAHDKAKAAADKQREALGNLADAFATLAEISGGSLSGVAGWISKTIGTMNLADKAGTTLRTGWEGLGEEGGNVATSFVNIAAGAVAAAAAMDQATKSGGRAKSALGGLVTGAKIGASVFGGFGAVIGGAAGLVFGFDRATARARDEANRLWGEVHRVTEELYELAPKGQDVNTILAAMELSFLDVVSADPAQMLQGVVDLTKELKERLSASNKEFTGLIDEGISLGLKLPKSMQDSIDKLITMGILSGDVKTKLGQMTGENVVDFEEMQAIAERYGIDLAALGPAFQSAKLQDTAKKVWDAFDLLRDNGANVGGVLVGMKDEIVNLATQAVQFGLQIPGNFRPLIDNLIQSTILTDEERLALQGLGDENFGEPIKSQWDLAGEAMADVMAKLDLFIETLMNNLPKPTPPWEGWVPPPVLPDYETTPIPAPWDGWGAPPNYQPPDYGPGGPGYASGGIVNAPASGMPVTVHGLEAIVPLNRPSTIGKQIVRSIVEGTAGDTVGGGGAGTARLDRLDAAIAAMAREIKQMPASLVRSYRDARLLTKGRG